MRIRAGHFIRNTLLLLSVSAICIAQNQGEKGSIPIQSINELIRETQKKYAPDHRLAVFEVEAKTDISGRLYLAGKTNLPAAKDFILHKCNEKKLILSDSIRLLPARILGDEIYAIVNLSVANIRSQPGDAAELATQALLGMPVNVLDKIEDWFLIQTPDDYIAWVDEWGIKRMNKKDINDWLSRKRIIFTNPYGFSYSKPDKASQTISDLVAGDVLSMEGEQGNYFHVVYPDGRKAYIFKEEAKDYDQWLSQAKPTAENLLATAFKLMGLPYLWGGTSFKGVDCSGFTKTVFFLNGIIIQRDASQQVNFGAAINTDNSYDGLQPGDLLFFGRRATDKISEKVSHVAIYLGNLDYIHSSGMVKTGSFQSSHPDYSRRRASMLLRGRRYLEHIGEKGIIPIKDSPYYQNR
jgi:gamma-D-glutamyl-L-lysine dipeptidyl-peptidase